MVLGINSFDQWGVELGKEQASNLLPLLSDPTTPVDSGDASTDDLVEFIRARRSR